MTTKRRRQKRINSNEPRMHRGEEKRSGAGMAKTGEAWPWRNCPLVRRGGKLIQKKKVGKSEECFKRRRGKGQKKVDEEKKKRRTHLEAIEGLSIADREKILLRETGIVNE